jgi:hypothetical protein
MGPYRTPETPKPSRPKTLEEETTCVCGAEFCDYEPMHEQEAAYLAELAEKGDPQGDRGVEKKTAG